MDYAKCRICGKEIIRSPSHIKNPDSVFCSRECYNKFRINNGTRKGAKNSEYQKQRVRECMLGERNHRWGKKQSESTIAKRAAKLKGHRGAWTGKKQPREMVEKRINNYLLGHITSEATKRKISEANKGKKFSQERREKMSRITSELMIKKGYNVGTRGKSGEFFSKKNGEFVFYRSSFEKVAYEILEKDNSVLAYKREPFRIPYKYDGLTRSYIPDILVITKRGKILIEVKANWEKDTPKNIAKKLAAIEFCARANIEYMLWTEDFLYGK